MNTENNDDLTLQTKLETVSAEKTELDKLQNLEIKIIHEILESLQNQQVSAIIEHRKTRQVIKKEVLPIANKIFDLFIIILILGFLLLARFTMARDIESRKQLFDLILVGAGASITLYTKYKDTQEKKDFHIDD